MSSFRAEPRQVGAVAALALLLSLTFPPPAPAQTLVGDDDIIDISPLAPVEDESGEGESGEGGSPADTAIQDTESPRDTESSAGAVRNAPALNALAPTPSGAAANAGDGAASAGTGTVGEPQAILPGAVTRTGAGSLDGSLSFGTFGSGTIGAGATEIGSAPTPLQVDIDSRGKNDPDAPGRYAPQGDAEGMGILGPNEGGFGLRLWTGTDRRVVEALLPRLPTNNPSATLYDLARRLLLSDAVMPGASAVAKGLPPADLLASRLERLAAIGEIEGLSALLAILPEDAQPSLQRQLGIELLLTRGRDSEACQSVRDGAPEDGDDRFWLKALTYCQIVSGERSAAELGLTILRESARSEDQLFLRLAQASLGLQPLNPADVSRLEPERLQPLEFALLTSLGLPLPPRVVLEAAPRARLQLIHDEAANLEDRTQAAEWAVATRRLPASELALLYGAFVFKEAQIDDALTEGYALPGVEARALYFQSIGQQPQPEQEIRAAELALERAEADGVYAAAARVVLPALSVQPQDAAYAWFADTAGRALYVLGRYEEATAWLLLARQEAAISARAAVAAHRLWPYSRLAGVAAISNESGLQGWRFAQPDPDGPKVAQQLSLLRVLFDALGESDAMAWIDLAMTDDERAQALPDASLLYALEDASYSGRLGETVLLALIVMGDAPPDEAHPLALNAVLSALMQVGLPLEARALAIEAALGNGI